VINDSKAGNGFFALLQGAGYYWFFFWLITIITILYFLIAKRFKERNVYVEAPGRI
jgi:hypothetical protein